MLSLVMLSLVIGYVCFRVFLTRSATGQLAHGTPDRRWRVRYADCRLSQTFSQEMAENHKNVFGGEVIRSVGPGDGFRRR